MQADGKIAEGAVGERKNALHAAGIQKAQRPVGIIAAQVEVLVEVLVIRLDGFCAEELVELAARPEREFGGGRFVELAGHPLTRVDHALGGLQHVVVFVAVFVHIRQRDGAELGRKAAVGEVDAAFGAVVDVGRQRDV